MLDVKQCLAFAAAVKCLSWSSRCRRGSDGNLEPFLPLCMICNFALCSATLLAVHYSDNCCMSILPGGFEGEFHYKFEIFVKSNVLCSTGYKTPSVKCFLCIIRLYKRTMPPRTLRKFTGTTQALRRIVSTRMSLCRGVIEQLGCTLTCAALAEDSHGLSTRRVHSEGIILRDLQQSICVAPSAQRSQLLAQAETHLANTVKSRPCWLIMVWTPTQRYKIKNKTIKLYRFLWGGRVSVAANNDEIQWKRNKWVQHKKQTQQHLQ